MDDDLKQLIEGTAVETRRYVEALLSDLRQEQVAAHEETRRYVDGRVSTSTAEIHQYVDASAEETRRHFDVVAESQRHEIQLIAESVATFAERMDRRDADVDEVTNDLDRRVTRLEVESTRR